MECPHTGSLNFQLFVLDSISVFQDLKEKKKKGEKVWFWLTLLMNVVPFYSRRDTTVWSSNDMWIPRIEKKWSVKKIRLTALQTYRLYSFSRLNMTCNCAVLPLFTPLRCSSFFLGKSLLVRICARWVLGLSDLLHWASLRSRPTGGLYLVVEERK